MTNTVPGSASSVLVTGASGLLGHQVVALLSNHPGSIQTVVAHDLRPVTKANQLDGVVYETGDIGDPNLSETMGRHAVDTIVHLAAIVGSSKDSSREREYVVDVLGTKNVFEAARQSGASQFIYASSGAAYGYHADNPVPLSEDDPLRGNPEFAYSDHKRLVEEMLARYRDEFPEMGQLILRPGTILGPDASNPITAIFERPIIVGIRGTGSPFVMITDSDVAQIIVEGILSRRTGIFNLAGDGSITLPEIAHRLSKRYLAVPEGLIKGVLAVLKAARLSAAGPEQVKFLTYRPVLSNDRLKNEFGFTPTYTSTECFDRWAAARFGPKN